jgi:hypothetical protein
MGDNSKFLWLSQKSQTLFIKIFLGHFLYNTTVLLCKRALFFLFGLDVKERAGLRK